MRILVCGASGFIGSAICRRLSADGHDIVRGVRQPRAPGDISIDYRKDTSPEAWLPRLAGIDAVVNAVGIIVEAGDTRFDDVHHRSPAALFSACLQAGVTRVIQVSALGADRDDTRYFSTKLRADNALMESSLQWTIFRPALVYGEDGDASRMFRVLASMPVIPVPGLGTATFQPVHVEDLAEAVSAALRADAARLIIELAGATAVSYRDMIDTYRRAMGFGRALYVTIPGSFMSAAAWFAGFIPGVPLNPETWRMLQTGSTADASRMTRLLGRSPKGLAEFIEPGDSGRLASAAIRQWRPRVVVAALALVAMLIGWWVVVGKPG